MRSSFGKLNVESLESRDNPSGLSEFWDGVTYYGRAALEGLGEGLTNIATGAYDAVVELGRTGRDLVTIYWDWDNVDPSRLESKLFQGAAQTAGNPQAAAAFDNHLVFGIVTLDVGPLAESGYNAVITGDSTQFSQQAGGFGVMVLVTYAGVKGLNALPPVPLRVPLPQPGMVLQTVDGVLVTVPGGVAWETVAVVSFAVPAEASTAISVVAVSMTGSSGSGQAETTTGTAHVPQLTPGQPRQMLGEAIKHVKSLPRDAATRADAFEALAKQIEQHSGGAWNAARGTGTDGSIIFLGRQGEGLVVMPDGRIFRGAILSVEASTLPTTVSSPTSAP